MSSAAPTTEPRVSSLELFFDLVFVFTITQLTGLLLRDPTPAGLLQMFLIFGNVWWMYGGYAWLTNAVPPRAVAARLMLLVGMGGFLLIALSIPTAFGNGGVVFGIGYLVVTLVHTGLFMQSSRQRIVSAVRRLGPFNLITAALLLGAGFTTGGGTNSALCPRVRPALDHAVPDPARLLPHPGRPFRRTARAHPADRAR